jgi:hypothetical protein
VKLEPWQNAGLVINVLEMFNEIFISVFIDYGFDLPSMEADGLLH